MQDENNLVYKTNGWDIVELHKFLLLRLNLFLLLKAPDFELKDNLKDVYIYFIISKIIGMKISSKKATHFVADILSYKDYNIIYNYKTALRRKGWFVKVDGEGYQPIKAFNYTSETLDTTISYAFNISYTKKQNYDAISSKGKPVVYESN